MNLIKNTLIFVVIIQLLGFLYFKTFYKQNKSPQIKLTRTIILPESDAYSIYDTQQSLSIIKKKTIKTPNHSEAYDPLKKEKDSTLNKKIELYAKKFLGNKYVWGATGPDTFDCSGFIQKVYRKTAGINLPRVSRNQAKVGKYIEYKKLKKGDMVFFDTEKEYTKRVNHVGIYLGHNKFIHASSARKKIIITSFKRKPFYKNRFLWGRRVLKDNQNINLATLLIPNSPSI